MNEIKYLVVHCSDSPDTLDIGAKNIHDWHRERGWDGIGYHAVIRRNGKLEMGRPQYWNGAHVRSYNRQSLGVCLVGRNRFTDDQMAALRALLDEWKAKYPQAEVVGHRDLDPRKTCPNFDAGAWYMQGA